MGRLTDRPEMTIDVYHGRKQQNNNNRVVVLQGDSENMQYSE